MKLLISTIVLVTGVVGATTASAKGDVCMPASEMKASLIDWYSERPVAAPTEANQQLWASKTTGTWTMIKTLADGHACVIAQGSDWTVGVEQEELIAQLQD